MPSTNRHQRRYDHRLRELVRYAKSIDVAVRHGVTHVTARGWLAPVTTPVVTLNVANQDATRLQQEGIALRRRIGCLDRRVLKHQWLYLNTLNTLATMQKLVAFYVEQHNKQLPHAAFHARRPTRCTSARAVTSPSNSQPPKSRPYKHDWTPIELCAARVAASSWPSVIEVGQSGGALRQGSPRSPARSCSESVVDRRSSSSSIAAASPMACVPCIRVA